MNLQKKIFFASDFHLGLSRDNTSLDREKRIVQWLEYCAPQAESIYLVGDIFDFWFEYKKVVPRGFVRFLGVLAKITDSGVPIFVFRGNHDLWISDYLVQQCGVTLINEPCNFIKNGKRFFIHHGDGLGPNDRAYKALKVVFGASISQFLFRLIHPDLGIRIAQKFSRRSRLSQNPQENNYLGDQKEFLTQFAKKHHRAALDGQKPDYYIFGHRHLTLDISINNSESRYINLGEWLNGSQYAVFDGADLFLLHWPTHQTAQTANGGAII